MEFYHNAKKLRKDMKEFLRRDFGIHSRKNASKIDPTLPDDWYDEDIIESAKNIRILLRNLIWNITAANTIHAKSERGTFCTSCFCNCNNNGNANNNNAAGWAGGISPDSVRRHTSGLFYL